MRTIISIFILALGVAQPSIAAIKESKSNRYADSAQFSTGAEIALLVAKKSHTAQGYSENEPSGDLIQVEPWGQGEYITKGSVTVLKALMSELRVMGYKVRLVDKPSLISPGEYVIAPNIVIRMAELKGRVAKWDNTRAMVKEKGRGAGEGTWSGSAQAVSILINAYNPEGKWLFKSYGGIAIPSYVDLRSGKDLIKENIYDKERVLVNGIKQVLLPLDKILASEIIDYKPTEFKEAVVNPLQTKQQRCEYISYLQQSDHKAYFTSNKYGRDVAVGYYFGAESIKKAIAKAKEACESKSAVCQLLDVDGQLIANIPNLDLNENCQSTILHTSDRSEEQYQYVKVHPPLYPEYLRQSRIEGWVIVQFSINEKGIVDKAVIIEEEPEKLFSSEALKSVRNSIYKPAYENGQPIRTDGIKTKVSFKLSENAGTDEFNCQSVKSEFDNLSCKKVK